MAANSFWATPGGWTLITVGQIMLVILPLLVALAFFMLADRKIWAGVQMRKGPNVVGPFGPNPKPQTPNPKPQTPWSGSASKREPRLTMR